LLKAIKDASLSVRRLAVEELGKIGDDTAIPALIEIALEFKNASSYGGDIPSRAHSALQNIGSEAALAALATL
jgi:HEAT repeat protein